jgi:hypothetical protein
MTNPGLHMATDLYVYYQVPAENLFGLRKKVEHMQQSLRAECGTVSALRRRPEEKDERQTWMEVYLAVPSGFDAALERHVAAAGLAPLIDGPRHKEYFIDFTEAV